MEQDQRIFLLHSLLGSIVSVRVENAERVPKQGGVLIVCNHSDLIDPLIQGLYTGRDLCYLAKAELIDGNPLRRFQRFVDRARRMGVPALVLGILTETLEVLSQLMRDARILPIVRGYRTGSAAGSLKYYDDVIANVVQLLRDGEAVAMYPEGGRSFDGKLKPFRGLAARIAIQAGVPVVPTALVGAYGFSDLNRWISARRPGNRSIIYRVGQAIDPREGLAAEDFAASEGDPGGWRSIKNKDAIKTLTRRLFNSVNELLVLRPRRPRPRRPAAKHTNDARTDAAPQSQTGRTQKTSQPGADATPNASDDSAARKSRKNRRKSTTKTSG